MSADIKKAFNNLQNAENTLQKAYEKGYEDVVYSAYRDYNEVAQEIAQLECQLKSFKDTAIKAAVQSGERTRDIAESYGISSARVSQIAPRGKLKGDI